jgi:hypothetical protein
MYTVNKEVFPVLPSPSSTTLYCLILIAVYLKLRSRRSEVSSFLSRLPFCIDLSVKKDPSYGVQSSNSSSFYFFRLVHVVLLLCAFERNRNTRISNSESARTRPQNQSIWTLTREFQSPPASGLLLIRRRTRKKKRRSPPLPSRLKVRRS